LCRTVKNKESLAVQVVRCPIWRDITSVAPDRADLHPTHRLPDVLPIGDLCACDHRAAVSRHHFNGNWRLLTINLRTDPTQYGERKREDPDENQPKPFHTHSFCSSKLLERLCATSRRLRLYRDCPTSLELHRRVAERAEIRRKNFREAPPLDFKTRVSASDVLTPRVD